MKQWSLYILGILLLSSCYDHENIKGEMPLPKYEVADSDDPFDHYIFEFHQKHGVYILYDYQDIDYKWNISTLLNVTLRKQADRESLLQGIHYMEKVFFNDYTDDFKKKYFPFKVLLADSIATSVKGGVNKDAAAEAGLSFMAIGKIRPGVQDIPADSLLHLKGQVQATYWSHFLLSNEILQLPEAFWKISGEYYGVNLKNVDNNSSLKPDEINTKKYGFWDRSRGEDSGVRYCMAPDKVMDIYQFIQMITTHTAEEMEALMADYDKLKDKYHLLVNHLHENFGIDIQAIGNAKSL